MNKDNQAITDEASSGGHEQAAREIAAKTKQEAQDLAVEAGEQAKQVTETVLESVASQLEDFAQQLRQQDLGSLMEHAQETAERSPELFFAGSVATGLAISRFMKASADKRAEADEQDAAIERSQGRAQFRAPISSDGRPAAAPPPPPTSSGSPSLVASAPAPVSRLDAASEVAR